MVIFQEQSMLHSEVILNCCSGRARKGKIFRISDCEFRISKIISGKIENQGRASRFVHEPRQKAEQDIGSRTLGRRQNQLRDEPIKFHHGLSCVLSGIAPATPEAKSEAGRPRGRRV